MNSISIRRLPSTVFIALATLLLLAPHVADAQSCNVAGNYVPNPSFECRTDCPSGLTQIALATSWQNGHMTGSDLGTPDYYNSCDAEECRTSTPTNMFGTQAPHQGKAYAGIYQYDAPDPWREYIRAILTSPLTAGRYYRITFYVNFAEGGRAASGKIGAIVGQDIPLSTTMIHPIRPQDKYIKASSVISDANNWVEVTGDFRATGGENVIVIGFFENTLDDRVNFTASNCGILLEPGSSYYYIDDVALVENPCFGDWNLVPNPSFECKYTCPETPGFFNSGVSYFNNVVMDWINGHDVNLGTPDYYNSCAPSTCNSGVPYNVSGEEAAHTGQAYAGIAQFDYDAGWREYIRTTLLSSLITGRRYVLKFYVSEAELSAFSAGNVGAIVGENIPLSTTMVHPIRPQDHYVSAPGIISRRNGWELVRGEFTATGHENNLVIGFFDPLTTRYAPPCGCICRYYIQGTNYLYIDDVSLQDCCDGLNVTAEPTEDLCTWKIRVSQNPALQCVYAIEVVDGMSDHATPGPAPLSLASGLTAGSITLSSPGTYTVLVRFLDVDGNVICNQSVKVDCTQELK